MSRSEKGDENESNDLQLKPSWSNHQNIYRSLFPQCTIQWKCQSVYRLQWSNSEAVAMNERLTSRISLYYVEPQRVILFVMSMCHNNLFSVSWLLLLLFNTSHFIPQLDSMYGRCLDMCATWVISRIESSKLRSHVYWRDCLSISMQYRRMSY